MTAIFFFQAEDGIRDANVTGVQTCALPISLAKDVGAGMLVWGDVSTVGDSIQVTAALYDLRRGGKTVRDYTVRIHKDGKQLESKFRELADSILLGGVNAERLRPDIIGTEVLAAFYAYADGRDALARWDLPRAE